MNKVHNFASSSAARAFIIVLCCGVAVQAVAQTTMQAPTPLQVKAVDENGVDIASGWVSFSVDDVAIGPLAHSFRSVDNLPTFPGGEAGVNNSGFGRYLHRDNFTGGARIANAINPGGTGVDPRSRIAISIAGVSGSFFVNSNGSYEAFDGGSLTDNGCVVGQSGTRTFVSGAGDTVTIDCRITKSAAAGSATQIISPNGLITNINYTSYTLSGGYVAARIQSVTRSDGFMLKYNYSVNGVPTDQNAATSWSDVTGITAVNLAVDYCDPLADTCTYSKSWPSASYSWSNSDLTLTVTDQRGLVTRYTMDSHHRVTAVKPPSSNTDKVTYAYCSRVSPFNCTVTVAVMGGGGPTQNTTPIKDRVKTVVFDGRTWNYEFPTGSYGNYYLPYKSTSPTGKVLFALSSIIGAGSLLTVSDPTGGDATYVNDERNRALTAVVPGKPKETYSYGPRGNVTGTGFVTAEYPADCLYPKTCNKPSWVQDARSNKTYYTYNDSHGGVATVTQPAVNSITPQTRYEYDQKRAWIKASGSGYQQGAYVTLLTATSQCRTSAPTGTPSAPCATAGDEIRTTYYYGPDSGPNNLLLRGVTTTGSGKTRTVCYLYDSRAQKIAETRPQDGAVVCP